MDAGILYRSALRPSDRLHPNKHLAPDGGESSKTSNTIIHVKSGQDEDQSTNKPMPSYDPDHLIGRTFLLQKDNNAKCLKATISKIIIETSQELDDINDKSSEHPLLD